MAETTTSDVFCAVTQIMNDADLDDINVVKCCSTSSGRILFMFRKTPFVHLPHTLIKKIQGVIGFKNEAVFHNPVTDHSIGLYESIEQLVLLENGLSISEIEFARSGPSVNTIAEYERMLALFDR